jgi:hypothetical protein
MLCSLTRLVKAQECTYVGSSCHVTRVSGRCRMTALGWFQAVSSQTFEPVPVACFGFRLLSTVVCTSSPKPLQHLPLLPSSSAARSQLSLACTFCQALARGRNLQAKLLHCDALPLAPPTCPDPSSSKSFLTHLPAVQQRPLLRSYRLSTPHPTSQPGGEVRPSASHSTPFGHNNASAPRSHRALNRPPHHPHRYTAEHVHN